MVCFGSDLGCAMRAPASSVLTAFAVLITTQCTETTYLFSSTWLPIPSSAPMASGLRARVVAAPAGAALPHQHAHTARLSCVSCMPWHIPDDLHLGQHLTNDSVTRPQHEHVTYARRAGRRPPIWPQPAQRPQERCLSCLSSSSSQVPMGYAEGRARTRSTGR